MPAPDEIQDPRPGIARNLRRLMDDRKVSVEQLVERAEIPRARVKRFLAAEAEPTARDLLRLAGALDSSVTALLERISWESDGDGGGAIRVDPPPDE